MMGSQNNEGLIPRLSNFLFELIAEKNCPSWQAKVEVSYMEIYNERIYDLLDPMTSSSTSKQSLKVREHNALGSYVDGLSQLAVISYQVSLSFYLQFLFLYTQTYSHSMPATVLI